VNEWVSRSLDVANSSGYLDKLSRIYPATRPPLRPLPDSIKQRISELHAAQDKVKLVNLFLKLREVGTPFPFEHPYASLLYSHAELRAKNPTILKQIGNALLAIPVSELIRGCERPADINRVLGAAFQDWIRRYFPSRGFRVLAELDFNSATQASFLDAANATILHYVKDKLGYDFSLGRDFLAKIGKVYIMGEARFFSTYGGSQTRDLRSTLEFTKAHKMNLTTVAVVDGVIWFNKRYVELLKKLKSGEPAITALLLEDFLNSFK